MQPIRVRRQAQQRIRLDSLFLRPLNLAGYAYHLKKVPAYTWRSQLADLANEEGFVFRTSLIPGASHQKQ